MHCKYSSCGFRGEAMTVTTDEPDPPDEGDVSDGEEADEDRAADDAGVPGVVPVQEGAELAGGEPHDGDHRGQPHW